MVDLSADLGEGAPREDEVWPLITSANVACGGHVGDDTSMTFAARRARDLGVGLGAHPSFPDREQFGRRPIDMYWRLKVGIIPSNMPKFTGEEEELWHVVNFLQALPYPQMLPPDVRRKVYDNKDAHAE